MILVSPAEPRAIREKLDKELLALGEGVEAQVSTLPEQYGVDFLWRGLGGWRGVQRKEFRDLYASMRDGRLSREIGQMKARVQGPLVVVEKPPQWTRDGGLVDAGHRGRMQDFTHAVWVGMHASLLAEGIGVLLAADASETARTVVQLYRWGQKQRHGLATARPGPVSAWGTASNREWGIHLLQGFPGIGAGTAGAIYDHFGGVPLEWRVTVKELMGVPGIGKKRAEQMVRALGKAKGKADEKVED